MDFDYQVSIHRPLWAIELLKKYPQLNDISVRFTDEDKDVPCFFAERDGITYHPHDFTIRINDCRLWLCKNHIDFLSLIFNETKIPLSDNVK